MDYLPHEHYAVGVNGFVFDVDKSSVDNADIVKTADGSYHMIYHSRTAVAKIIDVDATGKKMQIDVGGEMFVIDIRDELDQMLEKMGFHSVAGKHIREVKAPMPGLVLQISVVEGQQVNEGDKVLILEAMKMENSIMIPTSAVIKKIMVNAGQAVIKGQVLIELE